MPSYRFCRPDDIPYLVRAVNECYDVHFPEAPPMTVERYRAEMKVLDVWPSNCLVASSDAGPVAVLIGTKRASEVLVSRVGVRPGHLRQGHGGHLLVSLSQKLSVLGPDRLVVEVPRALPEVADFVEAVGYRRETSFHDHLRGAAPVEPVPAELVMPVTALELDEHGLLDVSDDVAWERRRETLLGARGELEGVAIASPERIEGYLLHRVADDRRTVDVVSAGVREPGQRELFLGLLLRHLAAVAALPLRLPRLAEGEIPEGLLRGLGFERQAGYDRFGGRATPV